MLSLLDRKIRQLHEALGNLRSPGVESVRTDHGVTSGAYCCKVDFNQGRTEAELANLASLLVANIACLKDHLKEWCASNGSPFEGDTLINTNRDVALVHDLWNTDKHATLTKSRSGCRPKVVGLRKTLALTTGPGEQGGTVFRMELGTGKVLTSSLGGGSTGLRVNGQIVDARMARKWESSWRFASGPQMHGNGYLSMQEFQSRPGSAMTPNPSFKRTGLRPAA